MSNIDWSKAPEGATHYDPDGARSGHSWVKNSDGDWFFACDCKRTWMNWAKGSEYKHLLIERPSSQAWTGTGLPPVGTVCEAYDHDIQGWVAGKVLMHGNSVHAFASGCEDSWDKLFWAVKFRPIRTQAQIEAEEREKAIKAMLDLDPPHESGFGLTSRRTFCEILHDNGYRKQEPKQ